ncbi:MAG: acetyl-CoA carboxylase biotin carboxyl carrier protein subunit [Chitinophagales bacterium]|nr:acetyl-CoA carboxylase biotin carboxyl carrier protein subunit [Chitinophagales bacterium]MDW8418792.1 acetyl-CoA carboxylase biotin carboxyl carrier protein subunit [Chitinophagales bacterium]
MLLTKVNNKKEWQIEELPADWDIVHVRDNTYHIIRNHRCYTATLIHFRPEEKIMLVRINNTDYEVALKDKHDLLLEKLGLSAGTTKVLQHLRAPMPGLILNINVQEGDSVNKGDTLLILEAMKMENAIKSPGSGKVKKIYVSNRQAVEKNQVLIEFE